MKCSAKKTEFDFVPEYHLGVVAHAEIYCGDILQRYIAEIYCRDILRRYTAEIYCGDILRRYTADIAARLVAIQ